MADTLQQYVQLVAISNGNTCLLLVKYVPEQIKGQLSVFFVVRLEHCLLKKGRLRKDLVIAQTGQEG